MIDEDPLKGQIIVDSTAEPPNSDVLKACGYRWQEELDIDPGRQQQIYVDKKIQQRSRMNDRTNQPTGTALTVLL
jgi:hypothetical protein